jgi:EAL domain-containing protein (putative c-di-GMP-specific phosphodiesterase class I)
VAGVQFRRPELVREMKDLLLESGLPARLLALEVTEDTVLSQAETVEATFAGLEALGIGVVLDRYGAGNAPLRALKRYPLHALKLDATMVAAFEGAPAAASLVPGIVQLAGALGLPVGARGVDTPAQAEALRAAGISFGQGALFSEALDGEAAEALLAAPRAWRPLAVPDVERAG